MFIQIGADEGASKFRIEFLDEAKGWRLILGNGEQTLDTQLTYQDGVNLLINMVDEQPYTVPAKEIGQFFRIDMSMGNWRDYGNIYCCERFFGANPVLLRIPSSQFYAIKDHFKMLLKDCAKAVLPK